MSYAFSGTGSTGTITITNEAAATMTALAAALPANVTDNGDGSFNVVGKISLVNSKLTVSTGELVTHTATDLASSGISVPLMWDIDSEFEVAEASWRCNYTTRAGYTYSEWGSNTVDVGRLNVTKSSLYMGDPTGANGVFLRAYICSSVHTFEDNLVWGGSQAGPGRMGGDSGSTNARNRHMGGAIIATYGGSPVPRMEYKHEVVQTKVE